MTQLFMPSAGFLQARGEAQRTFHEKAAAAARAGFGNRVFVRAVVEVSNYCRENCAYCGMRRDNRNLSRFRAAHEQLAELLRLRSEAGTLREQTNALRKLREEIRELQDHSITTPSPTSQRAPAETGAELSAEIIDAMRNVCHWLPQASQLFANDHEAKAPTGFSELRNYFPKPDGRRITGLYTFEFVRDDGPLPGDNLILREGQARQGPDGRWMRVYGFADGRVVEATSDDREFKATAEELFRRLTNLDKTVVLGGVNYYVTQDPSLVSADRHSTLINLTMPVGADIVTEFWATTLMPTVLAASTSCSKSSQRWR